MKIKVCGMRELENVKQLVALQPNYIGFIFFAKSARYVGEKIGEDVLDAIPSSIKKVGVFVNEEIEKVKQIAADNKLECVQLHGSESAEYCAEMKAEGKIVLKAFQVANEFDFSQLEAYEGRIDYFLFDTKCETHGGSGRKFDWSVLNGFKSKTPFFLSGGIDKDDAEEVKQLSHLNIAAVDINSKFEIEPALKNIEDLTCFFGELKST